MNGICDAKNCRSYSELELAEERAELCNTHWSQFSGGKPIILSRGREIRIKDGKHEGAR